MAPATAPMANGTMTEDTANTAPNRRCWAVRNTVLRKAKLAPRSTMPNAAMLRGTNRVWVMEL